MYPTTGGPAIPCAVPAIFAGVEREQKRCHQGTIDPAAPPFAVGSAFNGLGLYRAAALRTASTVPLAAFLGVLIGWRVLALACLPLLRRQRAKARGGGAGGGREHELVPSSALEGEEADGLVASPST